MTDPESIPGANALPPAWLQGEDLWLDPVLRAYRAGMGDAVVLGPGHDVAALDPAGQPIVVTTDVLIDGVHFDLTCMDPAQIARKAVAVNASDLAAAAAHPLGFVVGAVFPHPADRKLFDALAVGFERAGAELGLPCVGGDTNVAKGPLVLAVTALGRAGPAGVLSRSGAMPGMILSVTGPLGGSILGRHLTFTPRNREALALADARVPAAMMDLSDGLALDLHRLCRASGVGARLTADAIPVHPDASLRASQTGIPALAHALEDGEDFELLVAHAPLDGTQGQVLADAGVVLAAIGVITAAQEGVVLLTGDGAVPLAARGFDHLQDPKATREPDQPGSVPD